MTDAPTVNMPPDATIEVLARCIHEDYLASLPARDPAVPTHAAWDDLSEQDRELNRNQARDNVRKLALVGIEVVAEVPEGAVVVDDLDDREVEVMAKEEHRRWMAHRQLQGYQHGPKRVDTGPDLRHPDMVAWAELTPEVREKDRRPIRTFPAHLRTAGLVMVRR